MKNEMFDQWMQANRAAVEPLMKLNEITARAFDQITQQNLVLARDYMDLSARQLQLLGVAKDPQEWANEESKLVADFAAKLMTRAEDFVKLAKQTQDDIGGWAKNAAEAGVEAITPKAA